MLFAISFGHIGDHIWDIRNIPTRSQLAHGARLNATPPVGKLASSWIRLTIQSHWWPHLELLRHPTYGNACKVHAKHETVGQELLLWPSCIWQTGHGCKVVLEAFAFLRPFFIQKGFICGLERLLKTTLGTALRLTSLRGKAN